MTIPIPAIPPLRILLLDDDEVIRELTLALLMDLGLDDVHSASNGNAGLALLDSIMPEPSVLICDLDMPGMDGIEFLRHVADRGYGGDIVLLSGASHTVLKAAKRLAEQHGLGFLGILEKPVSPEALAAALAQVGHDRPQALNEPTETLTLDEVRTGLERGCVRVLFQPKVLIRERRVAGIECLARWDHPERGLLPPSAFIPVVEQNDLIDDLTFAVFRAAVEQQSRWRAGGRTLRLNVNISMDNLLRLDLPERLDAIVRANDGDASDVVLEVTESRLMRDLKLSLDILIRLRLKGFGLSIDDFGTGYSTMESLKQLPFTELKIDRAFVCRAWEDESAHAILESSSRLGRNLRLNVVAEGVETQEEWDAVRRAGCDEVQGYFVARPMPADEIPRWIKQWESPQETPADALDKPRLAVVTDMTGANETAALIQTIDGLSHSPDGKALADTAMAAFARHDLHGMVQVRMPAAAITRTDLGDASPHEVSMIDQMAEMEPIFQFGPQLAITLKNVSLLIHDMPAEDEKRCGHLSMHLAILAEIMNSRIETMVANTESRRRAAAIDRAVARLTTILAQTRVEGPGEVLSSIISDLRGTAVDE